MSNVNEENSERSHAERGVADTCTQRHVGVRWSHLFCGLANIEGDAEMTENDEISRSPDQARAGSTPHIVRYVLAISLWLTIAALGAALYFYFGQVDQAPSGRTGSEGGTRPN
jgi:hypothetical protein